MEVPTPPASYGIDLGELPDRFDRRLRIALVLQERAAEPQDAGGPGAGDEEPALRQRAVVARRHDQVLAAFAAIGPGQADVDDPAKPVSSMAPRNLGGISSTIGPLVRSRTPRT